MPKLAAWHVWHIGRLALSGAIRDPVDRLRTTTMQDVGADKAPHSAKKGGSCLTSLYRVLDQQSVHKFQAEPGLGGRCPFLPAEFGENPSRSVMSKQRGIEQDSDKLGR